MQSKPTELSEHLQLAVNMRVPGLDIMHGELKNLMYEAELELEQAQRIENESGEAINSMERTYAEGFLDALVHLYKLTYDLSFAEAERDKNANI
jgi:chemotaxis protein CheY-P-specific phosphatase CheC